MNNQRVGTEESAGGSVGLLMSILVRYPEVSSIKYDPESREIRFALMVGHLLSNDEYKTFQTTLSDCLDAYAYVTGRDSLLLQMSKCDYDSMTVVEIVRDVESLCQDEISLIISISNNCLGKSLVIDNDELYNEEIDIQDGIIDQLLDNLSDGDSERKLIGFREEGRVMIFNRSITAME